MKKKSTYLLILLFALLITILPLNANAQELSDNTSTPLEGYNFVNPVYKDVVSEEDLLQPTEDELTARPRATTVSSVSAAANLMREQLKNRASTFYINYKTTSSDYTSLTNQIYAEAVKHTGDPKAGDYIVYHIMGLRLGGNKDYDGSYYIYHFVFTASYYTTATQEQAVDNAVSTVLSSLNLSGKNNYGKAYAIYQYICNHVSYDYTHLSNKNYNLMYTAYAALINRTAVCQGYANLFYLMALKSGVDARLIGGTGYTGSSTGPHAWNIVQISGKYYNLDSTWDAGASTYEWFLNCPANFDYWHYRDPAYRTTAFYAAYPMASSDYSMSSPTTVQTLNGSSITLSALSFAYDGTAKTPAVTVKKGSILLRQGSDYKVSYSNNKNVGTATVTVRGYDNYSGSISKQFTITKGVNSITAGNLNKVSGQSFSLGAKTKSGATLSYKSNQSNVKISSSGRVTIAKSFVGIATITITSKGSNYNTVSKSVRITVYPAAVKLTKASNVSGARISLKWTKNSYVSGYQIQYSNSKSFKKVASTTKIGKASKTTTTSKKLKKGKTYYVRIRTCKGRYYSAWSSVKSVKIKK